MKGTTGLHLISRFVRSLVNNSMLKKLSEKWTNLWMPSAEVVEEEELTKKKAQLEIKRDRKYESRWVWYHTLLAAELAMANLLLIWIAINTL